MKHFIVSLFVLGFLVTVARAQTHAQATINNKPVYDLEVMPVVDSSLARMWDSADAVAEVRIESSVVKGIDVPDISGRPHLPDVRTFHTSRVLRVFAGAVAKDSTIVFTQAAGQLELADKILRFYGVDPLPVGDRYVVFLHWLESRGVWTLAGERDGAFRLYEGRVQPQGFGVVAQQQRNVSERQVDDELNRISRRAKPRYGSIDLELLACESQ
jgi:hypothetical protein